MHNVACAWQLGNRPVAKVPSKALPTYFSRKKAEKPTKASPVAEFQGIAVTLMSYAY
jgi:hypothetical protein